MNALNRRLRVGELVIVKQDSYAAPMVLEMRVFRCNGGGFGCDPHTSGSSIFGEWALTGEQDRIRGAWISVEETEAYQAKHGWDGKGRHNA